MCIWAKPQAAMKRSVWENSSSVSSGKPQIRSVVMAGRSKYWFKSATECAYRAVNGYVIIPEWPDLNRVISLHTRISNNFNQYAKKANEMGKLYEEDIAEIKKMNNEQTELLKKALEAVIHLYEEDSKKRRCI